MKILLINPPFNRLKGMREFYFPLGLGYLAAMLEKSGHQVQIYNMDAPSSSEPVSRYKSTHTQLIKSHYLYLEAINNKEHLVWKELRQVLEEYQPEVLALTAMSAKFQSAVRVAEIFKDVNPRGIVIVGGPHPTICPDDAISNPVVDFIIRGEGEQTIVELCQALENKKDAIGIPGISFINDGKIIHNPERKYFDNLDELPFPGRHLVLFPERYPPEAFGALVTLRGCPFRCAFCAAKCMWTLKVRKRSIDAVIEEIKQIINNHKTKSLFFWDDSFTLDKKRTTELCEKIIDNKLKISWGCSTRVHLLDEELVSIMKKAGCGTIELGVESGSERMLKLIKKDITISQVRKATKLLDKHNISYSLFLMVGFPEETKEDVEETIRFIKETKRGFMAFSIFTPYPGTELYTTAKNLGLIPEKIEWAHFSHQSPENAFTKYLTKEQLQDYALQMSILIDKHNSSFWRKVEFAKARSSFYFKNPLLFINKLLEELHRS